jgi:hypothetical protein
LIGLAGIAPDKQPEGELAWDIGVLPYALQQFWKGWNAYGNVLQEPATTAKCLKGGTSW